MGLFDFFKKKEETDDPISDICLENLKKGWILDYDMKTWQVNSRSCYDWGSGDITYEWQLACHDDIIYLEREPDDEDSWCISRKVPMGKIGSYIKDSIIKTEDPPEKILYEGKQYYQDEMGGGHFFSDAEKIDSEPGKEVLKWDLSDETGKSFITIERWGENEFEAAVGEPVEPYQFSNILPSE